MHNWRSLTSLVIVLAAAAGFKVKGGQRNSSLQLITEFQEGVHTVASGKIFLRLFTKSERRLRQPGCCITASWGAPWGVGGANVTEDGRCTASLGQVSWHVEGALVMP